MTHVIIQGPKTSDAATNIDTLLSWATFDGQQFTIKTDEEPKASYAGIYTGTVYRMNQFMPLRSDYTFELAMCWITQPSLTFKSGTPQGPEFYIDR